MEEIIHLINEMSPYLLLGFFLAGVMHAFVPRALYSRYLSARGLRSVLYAALLGIPLPLCSCGVIPTAMSLRREGASKGATVSFLIATPQTGVDSIVATYSLMGLPFAIIRPLVALLTALFGGVLVDCFDEGGTPSPATPASADAAQSCSCGHDHAAHAHGFVARLKEALHYAFVEMMQDIGKWLVVGLVVAGLITVLVPDSFFALFAGNSLMSILFVLLFSIPMYLCATGSIPIAVALMLKGLTPGAALVLLMAGPASNAASMLVIGKVLGRKSMLLYLLSIVGGAVVFGLLVDAFLPASWFALTGSGAVADCCAADENQLFGWICTALMALLLFRAFALRYLGHEHGCHCHQHEHHEAETCCGGDSEEAVLVRRFRVKGMNCNHCRANVEKALRSVGGVRQVEVLLKEEMAVVEGICEERLLVEAVQSLGFDIYPMEGEQA
ncbi:MAG: SO_0444 family Cu/Zn efflux transporter [Bacteroides sp.]